MNGIKAYQGSVNGAIAIDLPIDFAQGDSETAVKRKIVRHARRLGLEQVPFWGPLTLEFWCYNTKDDRRITELLKYANGKSIQRTAKNNWGKRNAPRH